MTTAVEWIEGYLKKFNHIQESLSLRKAFEQAKAMEKQQMWEYIKTNYVNGENSLSFHKKEFEQYYNETFKNTKE
jgi:hypothetical protein